MGLVVRRRITTGRNSWLNVSKTGASESVRIGRVTMNSRGRTTVRIGKGISFRVGKAKW